MRFSRSLSFACALACAACSSTSPLEKLEHAERAENSRVVESRRMREVGYGRAGSDRGAELLVLDKYKDFNMGSLRTGQSKTFNTGSAYVKDFNYEQKTRTGSYGTRGFWGSKESAYSGQRYATRAARTSGNYLIPNADKKADTKTAATKEAREADMAMAVRTLPDGSRQYLGKEKKKMETPVDPKEAANWRGASATVTTGGDIGPSTGRRKYINPVERIGQMKELSIEDLRDLLNKNK